MGINAAYSAFVRVPEVFAPLLAGASLLSRDSSERE